MMVDPAKRLMIVLLLVPGDFINFFHSRHVMLNVLLGTCPPHRTAQAFAVWWSVAI